MIILSSLTRAQQQEYLVSIEDAIASAVDYVQFNGQQVKFRSLDEMFRIRNFLRDTLGMNTRNRSTYRGPRRALIHMRNFR